MSRRITGSFLERCWCAAAFIVSKNAFTLTLSHRIGEGTAIGNFQFFE
jgi:hypothetical protein